LKDGFKLKLKSLNLEKKLFTSTASLKMGINTIFSKVFLSMELLDIPDLLLRLR
tara:strand:+ start:504 stop:665 length:162 start_codon:yes stop_codon:yes gene_type:complete